MVLLIVCELGLLVSLFHKNILFQLIFGIFRFSIDLILRKTRLVCEVGMLMLPVRTFPLIWFYKCHKGCWNIQTLPHLWWVNMVFPIRFLHDAHEGVWSIFYLPSTSQKFDLFEMNLLTAGGCHMSRWDIYLILCVQGPVFSLLSPRHESSSELLPGCQGGRPPTSAAKLLADEIKIYL